MHFFVLAGGKGCFHINWIWEHENARNCVRIKVLYILLPPPPRSDTCYTFRSSHPPRCHQSKFYEPPYYRTSSSLPSVLSLSKLYSHAFDLRDTVWFGRKVPPIRENLPSSYLLPKTTCSVYIFPLEQWFPISSREPSQGRGGFDVRSREVFMENAIIMKKKIRIYI
jgi:hypothetical protein